MVDSELYSNDPDMALAHALFRAVSEGPRREDVSLNENNSPKSSTATAITPMFGPAESQVADEI